MHFRSIALLVAFAAAAVLLPEAAGSAPAPRASICQVPARGVFTEPADVEVATLPLNAQGEHEVILAVHRDGERFCYHYDVHGVSYPAAPTLRVHQGEHFALRLVNDISGKSLGEFASSKSLPACTAMPMRATSVAYVGYLNHPVMDAPARMDALDTSIHLHGFQGPAAQENVFLSTLSTPMHACEYHITIPATQPVGTYFYHPHPHGKSGLEVGAGLTGAWIVDPATPQIARTDDHTLILRYRIPESDEYPFMPDFTPIGILAARLEASRKPSHPLPYDPYHPPALASIFPMQDGAFGLDPKGCKGVFAEPKLSINGADGPVTLDVTAGRSQLLRLVNATTDSFKLLRLQDQAAKSIPLRVVARDGVPVGGDNAQPLSRYVELPQILLPPAGRADVLVVAQPGQTLTLSSNPICLGPMSGYAAKEDLVSIRPSGAAASESAIDSQPVDEAQTPAAELLAYARTHRDSIRKRAITYSEYAFPPHGKTPGHPAFYITDTSNSSFIEHPYLPAFTTGGSVPVRADVVVKQGTIEEWTLFNTTLEPHTFHIHQMDFVDEDDFSGQPAVLDTALVPAGTILPNSPNRADPLVRPSATHILLDFRHVPKGTFLFHCHMLFHEDRGMMAVIRVT